MALTDKANMISRFGEKELRELTDRTDPRVGEIHDPTLDKAIASAIGLIFANIRTIYPDLTAISANPPDPLPLFAEDIARWFLYANPTPEVEGRYLAAINFLTAIKKGECVLGVDSSNVIPTSQGGADFCESTPRVFTNLRLSSFFAEPAGSRTDCIN